jgi:hypothetical protein
MRPLCNHILCGAFCNDNPQIDEDSIVIKFTKGAEF